MSTRRWVQRFGWPLPPLAGGAGAEDAGQEGGGQQEGAQAPAAPPAFDASPILERMGAVEERLGGFHDMMQRLDERLTEPTPDPLDQLLPADAEQDLTPDQVREALAHVLQQSQRGSQEAIQQALAPILAQQREDRVEMAAERLEQRRPELKEPANAEAAVRATVDFVNRLHLPDEYKAELMSDVELIEKIWVASQAGTQPAGEVPPGGGDEAQGGHELLDGSAAVQGGEDDDPAERIVRAGRGGGWMW